MPNLIIPPRDLPDAGTVFPTDNLVVDNGSTVSKATPVQIVNAGRPWATLEEAEAGTVADKSMSPLTTAAAIAEALGGSSISPEYSSRTDFATALPSLADGRAVVVDGVRYVVDVSATGMNSALWDRGVNGATSPDRTQNGYVSAFHDLNSPRVVRLYSSADGRAFRQLNDLPLPIREGASNAAPMYGGNPVLKWFDGWFYLLVELQNTGVYDFVIYKSRDLTSFQRFECRAGVTAVSSDTVPAPGASVPAADVWGADMAFLPDGTLDVWITLPFGPSTVDAYGVTLAADRRIYRTRCTNLTTLAFSAPVLVDTPLSHPARVFQSTTGALVAPTFPLNHLLTRNTPGDTGFDLSFSEFFTSAFPQDDLIIIPCGYGGGGFANNHWRAGNATYNNAVARINAVIAANPTAIVEGVLWHQGEADLTNATYEAELTDFISRLRTDVPQLAGKPFIMGEVAEPGQNATNTAATNAKIASVAGAVANAGIVQQDGLPVSGDLVHFASNSYHAFGLRYWKEFARVRGSVGSDGMPRRRIIVIAGQSNSVGWRPAIRPSVIDASALRTPTNWVFTVKDEILKTLRLFTGPSSVGPWTFQEVVYDDVYKIEGASIVPRRLASGSFVYDLFHEGHNDVNGVRTVRMMVRRSAADTPTGWGSREFLTSTHGIRHGSPMNLGFEDPAAGRAFQRSAAAYVGAPGAVSEPATLLASGASTISPQEGVLYYTTGIGQVCDVTIIDGPAETFHVACLSSTAGTGIDVLAGARVASPLSVGFGYSSDRMVTFRRQTNGQYVPDAGGVRAAFSAHKNGTAQVIATTGITVVTFPTEDHDLGGFYDVATSRWTPPAGRYRIHSGALVINAGAGFGNTLAIRKNGATLRQSALLTSGDGSNSFEVSGVFYANGVDFFDIVVVMGGPSAGKTVTGAATNTWFEGAPA